MHQTAANKLVREAHPTLSADTLNGDCHSALLDRAALQHAMQAKGAEWYSLVTERCPHLFADVPVFVTAAQMIQMHEVIEAVERVVWLPAWQESSILIPKGVLPYAPTTHAPAGAYGNTPDLTPHAPLLNPLQMPSPQSSPASGRGGERERQSSIPAGEEANVKSNFQPLGVFYGYDFHLNSDGAHLIEINSNAGGGFLNALLLDSQRAIGLPGKEAAVENLEHVILDMFRNEWRLARVDAPLQSVAIVDEQPDAQYLYPEFLLAQRMLERAGIAVYIADPAALEARSDGVYLDGQKIDLVYNRLTDFSLQHHPALRQAYLEGSAVVTPCPAHYARYADKRNLARLTNAQALRALGANEADITTLQKGIPHTIAVKADMEEMLWAERKQWFFKPNSGYGSKGAYRGEKLTRRVFAEILQGEYVAQKLAAPGERSVCVNDARPVSLKYDVRCYVYGGQVQLVAARLYQGQTTNFRTPGGGFAPVRVVE